MRGSQGSSRGDTWGGGTFDDLCDSIFSLSIILQLMMISIFFFFCFFNISILEDSVEALSGTKNLQSIAFTIKN